MAVHDRRGVRRHLRQRAVRLLRGGLSALLAATALAGAACSGDDCVEPLPADCTPAYTPTFEEVHRRTLAQSCAIAGGSCHASAGAQGGLILENVEVAYRTLVSDGRVIPGDAACSLAVMRIASTGSDMMPPGNRLSDSHRCAIETWIREGAGR